MATLTLNPIADNLLYAGTATTNYGASTEAAFGGVTTNRRHYLVEFDLSSLPASAQIQSVKFKFTVNSVQNANSITVNAYRVYRDWVEMQSTWNIYSTGNNWGTAGCENTTTDRTSVSSGSVAVTTTGAYEIDIDLDEFATLWADNKGLMIARTGGDTSSYKIFPTREGAANKPELVIEYTVGGVQAVWFA